MAEQKILKINSPTSDAWGEAVLWFNADTRSMRLPNL
jgi:hypothetical protein